MDQNEKGDAAYQRSLALAREILPNGPIGVAMAKMAINKGTEVDLASGIGFEEAAYAQVPRPRRLTRNIPRLLRCAAGDPHQGPGGGPHGVPGEAKAGVQRRVAPTSSGYKYPDQTYCYVAVVENMGANNVEKYQ